MITDLSARAPVDFRAKLNDWRSGTLDTVLMVVGVAAMAVVALDVHRATRFPDQWPAVIASTMLYAAIVVLAFLRTVDSRLRAAAVIIIGYVATLLVFARGGGMGNEQVFLLALPPISLIALGRRAGIVSGVLSSVMVVALALASQLGPPSAQTLIASQPRYVTDWLVASIVFVTTLAGVMALQWRSSKFREEVIDQNLVLLRRSERLREFNESIVAGVVEGIVLSDEDGMITFVNPWGAEMLGYDPVDLAGRPLSVIFAGERTASSYGLSQLSRSSAPGRIETALRTVSGKELPVLWSSSQMDGRPASPGTLSVFTDITDLLRARDRLRRSEETARAILDAATESMTLFDAQGRILDLNETAADRLAVPASDLIGRSLDDLSLQGLLPAELAQSRMDNLRKVAATGTPARFEDQRAGLTLDNNCSPVRDQKGQVTRLAVFSRDITQERMAERRARLAERLAATGRVAASLAHEINNPLQAVRSNLELLAKFDLDAEERRRRIGFTLAAIDRLAEVSQRALQLGAAEPGARIEMPVSDPVNRTLALMDEPLRQSGIDTTVELPAAPVRVLAAPDQIVQVLINVVGNAIDAMPDGGRLKISTDLEPRFVTLRVTNSGSGLAPHTLERLFDPYFTTKAGHSGLGLSLSRDIVELHGGTIVAENTEGGVAFAVTLPRVGQQEG